MKVKTALIMAAGLGTRFGKYTEQKPKGFIEVGGKSMIERSIDTLIACGIERIVIGTGYLKEAYEELATRYPQVECVFSPRYAETNSMYTLYNSRQAMADDDFLLLESDIIYDRQAIMALLEAPYKDAMLITPVTKFQDQYYVEYDAEHRLTNCSVNRDEIDAKGELVGIHKLSASFYKTMCEEYQRTVNDHLKLGYEYQLLKMSQEVRPFYVVNDAKAHWYEIDDIKDLEYAEKNIIKHIEHE